MKAVFISYNQALTERVEYLLEQIGVTGWTGFPLVTGKGTNGGQPRAGNHTWPEKNSAILAIVDDNVVPVILKYIEKLDHVNLENGIRAFSWDITAAY
jgi:hypothetical protein